MSTQKQFIDFVKKIGYDVKSHQLEGYKWCHEKEQTGGGMLCDDMGLGKTLMMLSQVVLNRKKRTLIVLPPILVDQWVNKCKKLLKHVPLVYHGINVKHYEMEDILKRPLVITTYGMIGKRTGSFDRLHWQSPLWNIKWDRVIYDEAHYMRNKETGVYKGALRLKAPIIWIVTGTPLQNNLDDAKTLASLLPYDECNMTRFHKMGEKNVIKTIKSHILFRSKKEAGIVLPPYNENVIMVPFKGENDMAYDIHSRLNFSNVTKENVNAIMKNMGESALPILTRARQICICPSTLTSVSKEGFTLSERQGLPNFKKMSHSKLEAVIKHILKNRKTKKLVFVYYDREAMILKHHLSKKGMKVGIVNGKVMKKEKVKLLNSNDLDVLIIQNKSGVEGLNLQQYCNVYFTSPHWNPYMEDQAIGRSYRIGQKNPVCVFKFVSVFNNHIGKMTLDQYCMEVQAVKRELCNELKGK